MHTNGSLLAAVLAAAVLTSPAVAGDEQRTHIGVHEARRVVVRYRPGSRAAASVERTAAAAERDHARIHELLDVKPEGRVQLWIYDDVAELLTLTGTAGNAGFSSGDASHVPYDADPTRFHEMVHVIALRSIPKSGDEPRSLFFAEGLANALLEHVHGVHVHAPAKLYRMRKQLPPLAEMAGAPDFYAWQAARPGFNGYDVAASWMRFLIDTHGIAKTKRYYGGAPAKTAFGHDVPALEKAWLAALDAYVLRPEVETLLRQRHGEDAPFTRVVPAELPADLLGSPGDWKPLLGAALHPDAAPNWKSTDAGLVGARTDGTGAWTVCELGDDRYGDCVVRARVTSAGVPVQVRLGDGNQAMLVNGTFLYRGDSPAASAPHPALAAAPKSYDLAIVRRKGRVEVWVGGERILELAAADGASRPGVGVAGGSATFTDVRVRRL